MDITIVVPFSGAEASTYSWAYEEKKIDFRREPERAARCTLSFAAVELEHYLGRTLKDSSIKFASEKNENDFTIELQITDHKSKKDGFALKPQSNGILVRGQGRTGMLYGAYEFLRLQGWRWYAPGKSGEIIPCLKNAPIVPLAEKDFLPDMDMGRGFYFEGSLKESEELWLWMARNRLNIATYRATTGALLNKLGMVMQVGGHIFENILNPDRKTTSGRTLWEEHKDWYGLPGNGIRHKDTALHTQFCISNKAVLEFLSEEFLEYVMGDWKEAERIDVWNFDTWGSSCTCNACSKLGNSTDQNLYFLSGLRTFLERAKADGRLDHEVKLVMCSYEGTATIAPPLNPIPENLMNSGDFIVFYPINRCYEHDMDYASCSCNNAYISNLKGWLENKPHMPFVIGEYYNVTKFEDLPIIFTNRISNDIPLYHALGARSTTYMHLPMLNWGMRTLTQLLFAQLSWDVGTDVEMFLEEYFSNRYGEYAEAMKIVYQLVEEAWFMCASWRAWSSKSILSRLLVWDGGVPQEPLQVDDHFKCPERVIEIGRESVKKMSKAMVILNKIRLEDKTKVALNASTSKSLAVNPIEVQKWENGKSCEMRLGEDRRMLIYGIDTMAIMSETVAYHHALYKRNWNEAKEIWGGIENIEERLDSYYIPLTFGHPGVTLTCKDALTRTQLRDVLSRCRKYKLSNSNFADRV